MQVKTVHSKRYGIVIGVAAMTPHVAAAQSMPWESPLRQVLASLQGPTLTILLTMAIIVSGLAFALGEAGGFWRKMAGIVFGGAVAVGAATLVTTLFGV